MSQGLSKVLDSNVLMFDPECIRVLGTPKTEVTVPGVVLQELGDTQHSPNEQKSYLARRAVRALEEYFATGNPSQEHGIPLESGGTLRVELGMYGGDLPKGFRRDQVDNQILMTCHKLMRSYRRGARAADRELTLVTKDINLRHRAAVCKIPVMNYNAGAVQDVASTVFGCVGRIRIEGNVQFLNDLYAQGYATLDSLMSHIDPADVAQLYANKCIHLSTLNDGVEVSVQTIYKETRNGGVFRLVPDKVHGDLQPLGANQRFAAALLNDPEILIVNMMGIAGGGKTLQAIAWAFDNLDKSSDPHQRHCTASSGKYERMVVFRSNTEAGIKLGFLPGDMREKFGPYCDPIFTTLEFILRHKHGRERATAKQIRPTIEHLLDTNQLIIQPPNFVRGNTYHDAIIVIDDAQNFEVGLLKLIMSRAGENSRIILTGDPTQIDSKILTAADCGVIRAAHDFRGLPAYGGIYLSESKRSHITDLVTKHLFSTQEEKNFWAQAA